MPHPIHRANKFSPFGDLTREEFYNHHQVIHEESFMLNAQNMKIFTQSWRLAAVAPIGLVAIVHGYASDSSWITQLTAVAIAKLGFIVFALDLRGHGFSEGPRSHVPHISPLVDDCILYFDSVRKAHPALPAFLYGESLGGAVAILISLVEHKQWTGLILNGAMCGISPKFKPPWPLEVFLPLAAAVAPRWRVVLTKSLVGKSYKEKWKRELVRRNPGAGKAEHPTAATSKEMLRVCEEIQRRCGELEVALLVVHGKEDGVCEAEAAVRVFQKAGSEDKTLKVVEGMWHMMVGEEREVVEVGFGVIFSWLRDKTLKASKNNTNA